MGNLPDFHIVYFTDCGRLKDRVLKHDLLHVLLIDRMWPPKFRFEDEYDSSIIQAVLMRDCHVSGRSISSGEIPGSNAPSLQEIIEHTVPGVERFIRATLKRLKMYIPPVIRQPSVEFVSSCYSLGKLFAQMFQEEFAADYAVIPGEAFKELPFQHVLDSFNRAYRYHAASSPSLS